MSPIRNVLDRLEEVSPTEQGWTARCPAHDDANPSLSVSKGHEGQVLLHCFAGCATEDVVRALGLEWRDLWPGDTEASWKPWEGNQVDFYTYRDADGTPRFQVVRFEMRDETHPAYGDKQFLQRAYLPKHPDAGKKGCPSGYVWGRAKHEVPPTLYQLPRVERAVSNGDLVFVVEGEKDTETLDRLGLTATCNPGGASRKAGSRWTDAMTTALDGAQVACLPDNDAPGLRFMETVAQELLPGAQSVKIVALPDLPAKGDVTDWLEAGHSRSDLLDLVEQTEPLEWQPKTLDELLDWAREKEREEDVFRNIDLLASAKPVRYSQVKSQLKEATGINLNDLQREVRKARKRLKEERKEKERGERKEQLDGKNLPVIVLNGRPSREVVDEAREALRAYNDPPCLFSRGGTPVHVRQEEGQAEVEEVTEARFDDLLSRAANVVRDKDLQPTDLPKRLLLRVMARIALPTLEGISEVPLLRPDSTVKRQTGYDAATQFLYRPDEALTVPDIPQGPSDTHVREARSLLHEAICDFPFVDEASRANTLALALTPLVQPLLGDANVPLAILDATKAGTGKSLLAEIVALMGTGRIPAAMSAPSGDSEWRKQITAQLIRGSRFILIDNVTGRLGSPSLERVLTSSVWSDRVLGASEQVEVPAQPVWVATGNNLRPKGDLVRRTYLIRMDAVVVHPWKRDSFRHKQPDWTREHRGELVAALLTLVRYWDTHGRPEPQTETVGSFERWCHVVGGILEAAGIEGFLGNLDKLYEAANLEEQRWGRLLRKVHVWANEENDEEGARFTAHQLARVIEAEYHADASGFQSDEMVQAVIDDLHDSLITKLRRREPIAHALGRMLSYRVDRRFEEGWYVEKADRGRDGVEWKVNRDDCQVLK